MPALSPLANPSATRAVLEAHGLATKHALGQNFLVSDDIVRKIVKLADLNDRDIVLEVGPGIGTLTIALLKTAGHVMSVERDEDLVSVLDETTAPWASRFTLLTMDALDLVPMGLPLPPNKFVANLPYAVAATLVLDYFERFDTLESATVMVQREVAERMQAEPGTKTYGAYTVKLRLFAEPAGHFPVAPGNFFPPPRVESTVLRLDRVERTDAQGTRLTGALKQDVCMLVDAAFASRRKTIANSMKAYFAAQGDTAMTTDAINALLVAASIDPWRRGETLSLDEFITLGKAYQL